MTTSDVEMKSDDGAERRGGRRRRTRTGITTRSTQRTIRNIGGRTVPGFRSGRSRSKGMSRSSRRERRGREKEGTGGKGRAGRGMIRRAGEGSGRTR